jgi:hypothetical protein
MSTNATQSRLLYDPSILLHHSYRTNVQICRLTDIHFTARSITAPTEDIRRTLTVTCPTHTQPSALIRLPAELHTIIFNHAYSWSGADAHLARNGTPANIASPGRWAIPVPRTSQTSKLLTSSSRSDSSSRMLGPSWRFNHPMLSSNETDSPYATHS